MTIQSFLLASLLGASFTLIAADTPPLEKPLTTETETGPFRVLIVGDYHAGMGVKHNTPALLEAMLNTPARPAAVMKVGGVHSDLASEWKVRDNEQNGSARWILGTMPVPEAKAIAEVLAKMAQPAPAPLSDPGDRKASRAFSEYWVNLPRNLAKFRVQGQAPEVVIFSSGSGFDAATLPAALESFLGLTAQVKAKPVLWATALSGAGLNPERNPGDFHKIRQRLDAVYLPLAVKYAVSVAPIYRAAMAARSRKEINLDLPSGADGSSHYGPKHGYLFACSLYAATTGKSPVGTAIPTIWYDKTMTPSPNDPKKTSTLLTTLVLEPLEAKAIQEVAWDVHQEFLADLAKMGKAP